ncbi:MAG: aspartate aminotransferase family protein [Planctomycetota bacterium]|nr:MAG: aspartate aminotransferase family protein [Planctomycetota bacterium]
MTQANELDPAALKALEDRRDSGVYAKRPLMLVEGRGARVRDAEGRWYVDCMGAHGAANLGHCHPRVVEAVREQVARLTLCPSGCYNDRRALLLEALLSRAPGSLERAFLCNSGAEAVEGALKFARLATGRSEIVAAMRAFHGRTLGALSATWKKKYREPFEPLVPGFRHVPYDDLERLDEAVNERTAAVVLEVVQGEGGVRPGSAEFLQGAQRLCRERGALLVIDEIQTGFGRTGRLWASEHHGLEPDVLCLAKSLGGGLPMGAVLLGERVGAPPKGVHGSTFGGNPLACAAALASLEAIEAEGLPARAARLGTAFQERLRAISSPRVREVRGLGLMVGVELKEKVAPLLAALTERGVLAISAGPTVVRFLPPLVIEEEDLERVAAAFDEVLSKA